MPSSLEFRPYRGARRKPAARARHDTRQVVKLEVNCRPPRLVLEASESSDSRARLDNLVVPLVLGSLGASTIPPRPWQRVPFRHGTGPS
jgi:hypothetical protein